MKSRRDSIRGVVTPNLLVACSLLLGGNALGACGPANSQSECEPNQSESCVCPLGRPGYMQCAADGTVFGACVCVESAGNDVALPDGTASGTNVANSNLSGGATGGAVAASMSNAGDANETDGLAGAAGNVGIAENEGVAESAGTAAETPVSELAPFSFFVTSLEAMQRLSKSQSGFGGDLRYGEADGLSGADKICTEIAEYSMPGSGAKQWRAFLSVTQGSDGGPVHAIDRIGEGPWYDRLGRTVALTKEDLLSPRPIGADPAIRNNLPNEYGVPNYDPDGTGPVDNHDTLTGTGPDGRLWGGTLFNTCNDWTSAEGPTGMPRCGHSWPRGHELGVGEFVAGFGLGNWMSALDEAGCAPGVNLIEMGPPNPLLGQSVGSGGGYGGIYCFALMP